MQVNKNAAECYLSGISLRPGGQVVRRGICKNELPVRLRSGPYSGIGQSPESTSADGFYYRTGWLCMPPRNTLRSVGDCPVWDPKDAMPPPKRGKSRGSDV